MSATGMSSEDFDDMDDLCGLPVTDHRVTARPAPRFTAECPVCHQRQPLVNTRTGYVYAGHSAGVGNCAGSGQMQ